MQLLRPRGCHHQHSECNVCSLPGAITNPLSAMSVPYVVPLYPLSGCRSCTLGVHLLYPSGATPDTRGALLYSRGAITYTAMVCNYCTLGEHLQYLRGQLLQSWDVTSILNGCNSCKLGVPSPTLGARNHTFGGPALGVQLLVL